MEFAVLGPVEVREDGRQLPLGGPKQRAVLAILLLARNDAVSRDRLIDSLWGEQPPATAAHTLDAYVSRLRKAVGPDRLTRSGGGYALAVRPGELDLDRFEELIDRGRKLLARREPTQAASTLRAALALWRGPALGDILYEPFAAHAAAALEDARLAALEDRVEADLERGESDHLVAELERLASEHPFRERLLGQLMLALYRAGQHARALEVYGSARRRLAEELGLEPGVALKELERAILDHDDSLAAPRGDAGGVKRMHLRALSTALAAAAVVALATVLFLHATAGRTDAVDASSNQLVGLAPESGTPRSATGLDGAPGAIAAGYHSVWLADPGAGSVARFDPGEHAIVDKIPVGGTPGAIAVGGGSVWVASVPGDRVTRIDPATGSVTQIIPLGSARLSALAYGRGALWVADATDESLLEYDAATGQLRGTMSLSVHPSALAVTDAAIWVADYDSGTVTEVEPQAGSVLLTVRVGTGPGALAATPTDVWVANTLDSTVSRISIERGAVTSTTSVGSGPATLVAGGRSIWVASRYAGTVSRIDGATGRVDRTTSVGGSPTAIAIAAGRTWVGTQSRIAHRGGTLTLVHARRITIDPALQADLLPLVSEGLTRDGLVTYDHAPGVAGTRLVPDLALNMPLPTASGTTYTFRLRPGIRYSDGRRLAAADFRRAIERAFRLGAQARVSFTRLVGAAECTTSRCDLSHGVVGDEAARTVTFHLRAPDPNLLVGLAGAVASAVPSGAPLHPVRSTPIVGTGPYAIAHADARSIRMVRNPYFHEWSHAAQPSGNPDRIVVRFGSSPRQEVREIEHGRADVLVDNIPSILLPRIRKRYASRLHSFVIPTTDFFQLNTTRAPFADVRVRRALNLAIDRRAIVRLYGGALLATTTCQVLPPGVAGYRQYCPYTRRPAAGGAWTGPDLAGARRLVAASGTRGQRVTVWGWTDDPTISGSVVRHVGTVMRQLGYRVSVRLVSHSSQAKPGRSAQLVAVGWGDTPYGYFANWFGCGAPNGHGWFCDPKVDRMNLRARSLETTEPRDAAVLWARIDRLLVDRAVWLPMINERSIDFLSARLRNYQSHPYWGLLADQLWID